MNISKLIIVPLVAILCVSCGSSGGTSTGAAAPVAAAPAVAPAPVVQLVATIIDDFGQTCPRQNSTMCGGFGIGLVPASGGGITGMACGPGTAPGQWVQNFEWVPC